MPTIRIEVRYAAKDLSRMQTAFDEVFHSRNASLLVRLDMEMITEVLSHWGERVS
jgi:hypothetical protein